MGAGGLVEIAKFEGTGTRKTKPFQIPDDAVWFTFSWVMEAGGGEIGIHSIESPTDPFEVLQVDSNGDSVFYGCGTYFFSINTPGSWTVTVQIDDDAWSDQELSDTEFDNTGQVLEQSFRDPNWQPARMDVGDWYYIFAPYSDEIVAQMRANPSLNFVEDLSRGYIFDETQQIRLSLSPRSISKIESLAMELDGIMRNSVADLRDNYPNGSPTPSRPIDEQRFVKAQQQGLKLHLSISNVLRKEGSNATFYIASGKHRVQFVRVSSFHSMNQRQANREAAALQWEHVYGPRRAASAWFDEANRRGY